MTNAPLPANEPDRLVALRRYGVLDTPPEAAYDDVVRLAAQICGTPTALISLVDADRQWFKARVGLDVGETPRDQAFCAHALGHRGVFEVPDAASDSRFADNPLVTGGPGIRFYAGAPLVTDGGEALGTVCVIDRVPRELSPAQQDALQSLSRLTLSLLEARRGLQHHRALFDAGPQAVWVQDARTGAILDANAVAPARYGYSREEFLRLTAGALRADAEGVLHRRGDGRLMPVEVSERPVDFYGQEALLVRVEDVTARHESDAALQRLVARNEHLTSAIPSVLVSVDESGRITHWNAGAERTLGRPGGLMVGLPFAECGIAWDWGRVADAVRECLGAGRPVRVDDVALGGPGGAERLLGLSLSPMRGPRGESQGFLLLGADTTERRRMEGALAERTALLGTVLSTLPQQVSWKDHHGVYRGCNETFARAAGLASPDDVLGKSDGDLPWTPEEAESHRALDRLVVTEGWSLSNVEQTQRTAGGATLTGLTSKVPMRDAAGRIIGVLGVFHDIAERKQAEAALHQRQAEVQRANSLLRAQQEAAPDGILIVDERSRIVSYNRRLCETWRTPDEIIQSGDDQRHLGHALSLMAHPDEFLAKVRHLYDHPGESSRDELLLKDGRILDRYSGPVVGEDGELRGRVWYFRDVTERRRDEERLLQSAVEIARQAAERDRLSRKIERLSLVATKTTNAVVISDAEGRIEWANDSFTRITGYELAEVVGRRPGGFLQGPATDPAVVARLRDAVRAGQGFEGEIYNYHKLGRGYWVALSINPLYADDGTTLQGFISIQTDVWTDRKRSEEETARLAAIVESSKDAIIGKTLDGTIISWNRGAERLYGYMAAEVIGQSISLLIPKERPDELPAIMEDIRQGKPIEYYETVRVGKSGRQINVALTISPISDSEGRLVGAATIARDVTERTRMQGELVQARDAALAAARLKSEFLANMSHEIRTPMNGVIGMSDLLLGTALDPEQQEYARIVKQSADALLTIINDILDFSKIEAGKMTIEMVDFSLRAVLEDVAALMAPKAAEKGQALVCALGPETSGPAGRLQGDPGRLRQVITNLLGNAAKFTGPGGTVTLGATPTFEGPTQVRWRLFVRDTGIGIPPERRSAIFESFTQADGSTTRRYGGTGLGLTISRQLVTLMGGQIGVESEVGRGSEFWVDITLDRQGAPAEAGAPAGPAAVTAGATPADLGALRVLLAEDNPINQKVARRLLQQAGVSADNLSVVNNGREALGALAAGAHDLVLMDIQMPEMDGLEATAAVRVREHGRGGRRLPIIAMTAHAMAGDRERCLAGGMDDYITKPLRAAELAALLARWTPALVPEEAHLDMQDENGPGLDRSYLDELCGGDADFERELLEEFLSATPGMVTHCRMMQGMGDAPGLQHWAHTLKSGARTVGASALAGHCQSLEDCGQRTRLAEAAAVMPEFERDAACAQEAVRRRLAELGGPERVKRAA